MTQPIKTGCWLSLLAFGLLASAVSAQDSREPGAQSDTAEHYLIDTRGAHAFVQFRIPHLGYSWLYGRFNNFAGHFTFDPENPANSSVDVTVQTTSVDSNHERRDNHLRNEDFLNVAAFPEAHFRSTAFTPTGDDNYT